MLLVCDDQRQPRLSWEVNQEVTVRSRDHCAPPWGHDGLRPDQDMGMWLGETQWSPWPGRAGLWDLQPGPAAGSLGHGLGELPRGP